MGTVKIIKNDVSVAEGYSEGIAGASLALSTHSSGMEDTTSCMDSVRESYENYHLANNCQTGYYSVLHRDIKGIAGLANNLATLDHSISLK